MRRHSPAFVLVVALLLTGGAIGHRPAAPARAQVDAAAELAAGLPEGVELAVVAGGVAEGRPEGPAVWMLERVPIAPGPGEGLRPAEGPELIYVEFGTLLIVDELGIEGAYAEGTQLFLPAGVPYGLRNDGTESAIVLRLRVLPAEAEPSAAATAEVAPDEATPGGEVARSAKARQATPEPAAAAPETVFSGELGELEAPLRLVLVRLTFQPGAELPAHTFTGPVGLIGESGVLTIAGPSGIEGQLRPGQQVAFPVGTVNRERNAGDEPVTILLAGVVPAGGPLVTFEPGVEPGPPRPPTAAETPNAAGTPAAGGDAAGPVAGWPAGSSGLDAPRTAGRTGQHPGPAPEGEPVVRWRFDQEQGARLYPPAVVGGTVYVGIQSDDGQAALVAIDAGTGAERWRFEPEADIEWVFSPAVVEGLVLVGTEDAVAGGGSIGELYALDAETGEERWRFEPDQTDGIYAPVVVDGTVYAGSYDADGAGRLYALRATDGAELWRFEPGGIERIFAPAVADGQVYVGSDDDEGREALFALNAADGAELWRFAPGNVNQILSPAVAGGVVLAGSDAAAAVLYALDAATGQEIWRFAPEGMAWIFSPAVAGGVAYAGSFDPDGGAALFAVDVANGQERWRNAPGETSQVYSPALADGLAFAGGSREDAGIVLAIDVATGQERWRFAPEGTRLLYSPAVVDGVIYVASATGGGAAILFAVGGDAGALAITPTPLPISQGATVVVTQEGAVLRGAPSPGSILLAELPVGAQLVVVGPSEERGGTVWWQVEVVDSGLRGYISAADVAVET